MPSTTAHLARKIIKKCHCGFCIYSKLHIIILFTVHELCAVYLFLVFDVKYGTQHSYTQVHTSLVKVSLM